MGERSDSTAASNLSGRLLDGLTEAQLRAMLEKTFAYEERVQIRSALRQLKKKKAGSSGAAEKPTDSFTRRQSQPTLQVEDRVSKKPPDVKYRTKSSSSASKQVSNGGQRIGTSKRDPKEGRMETTYQKDANGNSSAFLVDHTCSHQNVFGEDILEFDKQQELLSEKPGEHTNNLDGSGEKDSLGDENGVSDHEDILNISSEEIKKHVADTRANEEVGSLGKLNGQDGCPELTSEQEEGKVNGDSRLQSKGVVTFDKADEGVIEIGKRESQSETRGADSLELDLQVPCSRENAQCSPAETGSFGLERKESLGGKQHILQGDGGICSTQEKGQLQCSRVESTSDALVPKAEELIFPEEISADRKSDRLGEACSSGIEETGFTDNRDRKSEQMGRDTRADDESSTVPVNLGGSGDDADRDSGIVVTPEENRFSVDVGSCDPVDNNKKSGDNTEDVIAEVSKSVETAKERRCSVDEGGSGGPEDTKSGDSTRNEMDGEIESVETQDAEIVGTVASDPGDGGLIERKGRPQQLKIKSDSTDSGINGDDEETAGGTRCGDAGIALEQEKAGGKEGVRLEDIEEEAELRRLLDSSSDFDERREIRAAMRALKKKRQDQPAAGKKAPPQLSYLGLAGGRTWQSGRNKFVPGKTSTPKSAPPKATPTTRRATEAPDPAHSLNRDKTEGEMPVLDASDAARDVRAHSRHRDSEVPRSQQERLASREDATNLRSFSSGGHSSREGENVEKETSAPRYKIHDCLRKNTDREEYSSSGVEGSSKGGQPSRGGIANENLSDHGLNKSKMCDVERKSAVVSPLVDTSMPRDEKEGARQRRREWQNKLLRSYDESNELDMATTDSKEKVVNDNDSKIFQVGVGEDRDAEENVRNKNVPSSFRKQHSLDERHDITESSKQISLSLTDLVNGNVQTDSMEEEKSSSERIEDSGQPEEIEDCEMFDSSEQTGQDHSMSGSEDDESSKESTGDLSTEIDVSLISTDEGIGLRAAEDDPPADREVLRAESNTSGRQECSSVTDTSRGTEDCRKGNSTAEGEVSSPDRQGVDEGGVGRRVRASRFDPPKKADFRDIQLQFQKGVEKKTAGRKEDRALKGVRGKVSQAAQLFNTPSTTPTSPKRGGLHSPLRTNDRNSPGTPRRLHSPLRRPSPTSPSRIRDDRRQRVAETGSSKPEDVNMVDASDGVSDDQTLEGSPSRLMYATPPATPGSPDTFYTPGEVVDPRDGGDTPKISESAKRGTTSVEASQITKRTKVGDRAQLEEDTEPPDRDTMAPTVEQITDETTLEKMLEEATIFEDRKKIRARLRELRKQKRGDTGTTVTTERKRTRATALTVNTSSSVETNNNSSVRDTKFSSGPEIKAVSPISPAAKTIRTDNHVTSVEEKDDGTTKTMTTTSVKSGPGMKSTQVTTMSKSDDGAGSKSASMTKETTSTKTEKTADGSKSFSSKTTTSSFSSSSSSTSTDKAAPAGKPMSKFQRELEEKKRLRAEQQKKDQEKWKSDQEARKKSAYEKKKQEEAEAQKKKASLMDKFGGKASNVGPVGPKRSVAAGGTRMMVQNPASIKAKLLEWSQRCTRGYQHVDISNFSGSWCDGMAFCAIIHAYYPDAFEYEKLDPKNRRANFDLAFDTAEKLADIYPLLETNDMIMMKNKPDWKCVFTYVQALYRGLTKGTGQMPS